MPLLELGHETVKTNVPESGPGEEAAMALLRRVAQERDREAFTRLFELFETPAFNLALRILGNRAVAEEALQDAMLRIWRSADTFHWEGSVRSWIFRIVANQSVRAAQKRRRERLHTEALPVEGRRGDAPTLAQEVEREEERSALHQLLDELPHLDRQLVTLYFGAGMTQREISASLSVPQRTVSAKIQKTLEALRAGLARAGVAALAPLGEAVLGEALRSGSPPPAGLCARTLAKLDLPGAGAGAVSSERTASAPALSLGGRAVWAALGGAALLAAGGALWWTASREPVREEVRTPGATELPADSVATPASDPAAATTKEVWQPYPTEPLRRFALDRNPRMGSAQGLSVYDPLPSAEASWVVHRQGNGTLLEQQKVHLRQMNCVAAGPLESEGKEVQGLLDYEGGAPGGQIMFLLCRTSGEDNSAILANHEPESRACRFRIFVWPTPQGIQALSVRETPRGRGVYAYLSHPAEGGYGIGFATSTKVAFRNLRVRRLPPGWTPEDEPELKSLRPQIHKVLDEVLEQKTPSQVPADKH